MIFADEQEGKRVQDIWEYKDPQYPTYPTEKNSDLLDLIIRTSSHEKSIVLDCFCGGGTTLKLAHINNRKWIGIDQSHIAIKTTINNLELIEENRCNSQLDYDFFELKNKTSSAKPLTKECLVKTARQTREEESNNNKYIVIMQKQ